MENRKTFGEFVKTASDELGAVIGSIPINITEDAYRLYNSAPVEKLAAIMDQLYESIEPGYDKIALDIISANLNKDLEKYANFADTLGRAVNHPYAQALQMAAFTVPAAMDIAGTIKDKLTRKKERPGISGDAAYSPMEDTYN